MTDSNPGDLIKPLTEDQAIAFAEKLGAFRQTLLPHEQAMLDVMAVRVANNVSDTPDVQGYEGGNSDTDNRGVSYGPRYVGPDVIYYPVGGFQYGLPVYQPVLAPQPFPTYYYRVIR